MKRGLRNLSLGCIAAVVLFGTVLIPQPSAGALPTINPLPGGRSYYVVSLAHLDTRTPTQNWVRLSFYRFDKAGKAYMGYWYWGSNVRYGETEVLRTCPYNCPFYAVPQYVREGPKQLEGSYTVSGNQLTISWSTGAKEAWTINSSREDTLASLVLSPTKTNYPTTYGHGFGSKAGWNTGANSTAIYDRYRAKARSGVWALHGESYQWLWQGPYRYNETRHTTGPTVFEPTIKLCSHLCLTVDDGSASYYYATTSTSLPRKLMREMFVDSHKVNNCYQSTQPNGVHAHLIPALEIIDDAKQFRGWVSVEVSMWPNPEKYTNYLGVNWYLSDS
jgi:hypothetical protein